MSDARAHAGEPRHPAPVSRASGKASPALVVVVASCGGLGLATWLQAAGSPGLPGAPFSPASCASFAICVLATTATVSLRWVRWHFLLRHYTLQLATRDSFAAYLATLPALVTPLCVGEILRLPLMRKRFPVVAAHLVRIWLIERTLDIGVLCGALLATMSHRGGVLFGIVFTAAALAFFRREPGRRRRSTTPWAAAAAIVITIAAWGLLLAALALTFRMLSTPLVFAAVLRAFAERTLLGGAGGFPIGALAAGSPTLAAFAYAGVPAAAAAPALAAYRAGTAWFAVLFGLAATVVFRRRLIRLVRGEAGAHFDDIAVEYEEEIPLHVRRRLLGRKVGIIDETLAARGVPRAGRGLDLGCGQGWYLAEMCARGYTVDGSDYSAGQLSRVRPEIAACRRRLVRADARALPFADGSYDFVYGINAIHHLLSEDAQQRALREIVRVLRPGGAFLLHEINTNNPVFRGYMGYVFPLLKKIDQGNELWIVPDALPDVPGARWAKEIRYFTFLPDFVSAPLLRMLAPLERTLERSRLRRFSAHYQACLVKDPEAGAVAPR